MDDKIILESRFTKHQKTHMILSIGAPLIIIIFKLIRSNLNYKGYLVLAFFIALYAMLVCLAFTRKGLLKINSHLYRGLFFYKTLILKKKIDLTNKPKVSILKFRRRQKMAWFTAADPDLASTFNAFDVTILNERHTQKEAVISLSDEAKAEKVIHFLTEHFNLNHEIYSPW